MNVDTTKRIPTVSETGKEGRATSAYAFVYYDKNGGAYPYKVVATLYASQKQDEEDIVGGTTGTFASLGDALVYVSNIVRARQLDDCRIEINAQGQPPVSTYSEEAWRAEV